MSENKYRVVPDDSPNMPPGIPYIVGNEAAERFSFYGMKAILTIFMTQHLMNAAGQADVMTDGEAKSAVHFFVMWNYFTPILGAILADWLWGKYRTILGLSLFYCAGHLALALDETRLGLTVGLTLIAIGSGGIKPCVTAHVGDQFGKKSSHLLNKVFNWFYFSINLGAFLSTLLTPVLLEKAGPAWAFGVPGFLMMIATIMFWCGRNEFVHIPPKGREFWKEVTAPDAVQAILKLLPIYILVSVFWSCFDQTASAWVLQATSMEHQLGNLYLFGSKIGSWLPGWLSDVTILDSQMQAVNPIMILIFIPLVSRYLYPAIDRFFKLTYLRKICIGMFLCGVAFTITSLIQKYIDTHGPNSVHIQIQILPYFVITLSEVMVSITCLEFSYTQAPNSIKSLIMSIYLLSVSLGNFITYLINVLIMREDGSQMLEGADYYWLFTGITFGAAILLSLVSLGYREVHYLQGESEVSE
ncbi:MAG: POT family MFS transporter [Planctomycetaceae bacterium]